MILGEIGGRGGKYGKFGNPRYASAYYTYKNYMLLIVIDVVKSLK